ncbi:MAG: AraC family transcriptional regulator [Clostridia bacterium]|nr:AraC family transcriptional regulator [Clostridia bacterium]
MDFFQRNMFLIELKRQCSLHTNPEMEVLYVKKGKVSLICGAGEMYEVTENSVVFILPYHIHKFIPSEDIEATVFMFPFSIHREFTDVNKNPDLDGKIFRPDKISRKYIDRLFCDYIAQPTPFLEKGLFFAFLNLISINDFKSTRSYSGGDFMHLTAKYVYDHIAEAITASDISKSIGYTPRELSNKFKETLGIKLGDFIGSVRIQKACDLLLTSDMSVTEISGICGFGSLRNFNRIFLLKVGETPSEYRKSLKKVMVK